ncbi:homoserine O-acetyltransferase [Corynebacterium choanae]|uniref:Homoserine O-acetyltransferase n=1 Tax=Corynebacterium choanae TaxID=1862358 RepID=A0A3G6JC23_9CORY|nr:homoserine O-acetyltransferase [Corynebacterium choanae]AZA14220.1 Homoserine O-acetyltransferase [Corynebacterium choanae]
MAQTHTVTIPHFVTEASVELTHLTAAYAMYGTPHIQPDGRSNILLVEHALTGDHQVDQWWGPEIVGPEGVFRTDQYCVLSINTLGGCMGTTGPGSIAPDGQAYGSRFPALTIRDLVHFEAAVLDELGIREVAAVIGGSMGGAKALEWTLLYPQRVRAALVLAVSARASAWQIGIQKAQMTAITRDPHYLNGDYYHTEHTPQQGLAAARKIAHLTYRGELEMDERFGTDAQTGENPLGPTLADSGRFAVESYLDHQASKLVERFDAGSYMILTEALNRHDIGRGRGGLNKALASSTVPTFICGVDTDILYPYHQQEHLARNLGNLIGMAKITSPCGHDAFLTETRQLVQIMHRFITRIST